MRIFLRINHHFLTSLLLLLPLTPSSAHAQANQTIGGAGAGTGGTASDTTTQGAQLAENDGLYTCSGRVWTPEMLVVGSVLQSGAAPTCSAATASMLYYPGGTVEYCNGTSFTAFGSGGSLNNVTVELAAGSAAAPSLCRRGRKTSGFFIPERAAQPVRSALSAWGAGASRREWL